MKKHWLEMVMIIVFILKLAIVHVQPVRVINNGHDDRLYVVESINLVEGNWLGDYNDRTLSKGVTAVLFIAMSYQMGISYLTMQQIFYFIACVSMIFMLKHLISNKKILLLCYLVLLWNPISYSDAFSYVYRDGVYTILMLFFVAFSFQMFFHYKKSKWKLACFSTLFGLTFAAIYLCREETIWLLPYLIVGIGLMLGFIIGDKDCKEKISRIFLVIGIPLVILTISTLTICYINYQHYGRFILSDFTSKEFKDAYGALTRIKQENYIKRVPLNEETRRKLYQLSPKFKELKSVLEADTVLKGKETKDFQDGFLWWAIRDAAYHVGYYEDAETAKNYYIDLANEINALCDSRTIGKLPKTKCYYSTFPTRVDRRVSVLFAKDISGANCL